MPELQLLVTHDGQRNAAIQITGRAPFSWTTVLDIGRLKPVPRNVALDAVYYVCADKVEVQCAWETDGGDPQPFLPLGGRGRIDFSEVKGIRNNAFSGNGHIAMQAFGEGLFTIILDLSKHMEV